MTNKMKILIALMIAIITGSLAFSLSNIFNLRQKPNTSSDNPTTSGIKQSEPSTSETATSNINEGNSSYALRIEKLGLEAPIIPNIDGNNKEEYMKALESGVAQMAKTALPGEAGNTVIFGHSSYYESKPGGYKTIFADLDKLAAGDIIQLSSGAKIVSYTVIEIKTVKPEDVSIVNQNKNEYKLTLITCWPPKTTNERLVVVAKEIQ